MLYCLRTVLIKKEIKAGCFLTAVYTAGTHTHTRKAETLLDKLIVAHLVNTPAVCFRIPSFIIAFTRPSRRSLPSASSVQSLFPNTNSNMPIIVPSALRSSECGLLFRHSNKNSVSISQLHMRATCLAHLILLDFIILTISGEEHNLCAS
jgi:hypothetical protein